MGEALRHHAALGLLLQRVVADRLGGAHAFLDVALFERARALRPDTGVAIGLELDPDLELVALGLASAGLGRLNPVERAFEVLNVVADLMGDDIGLGGVARGAEALAQFVEEVRIDVDPLVAGAVEGPHRRLAHAASGLRSAFIGDQAGRLILPAGLVEYLVPDLLGAAQHLRQESALLLREGRLAGAAAAQHAAAAHLRQDAIAQRENQDSADAEARCDQGQDHPKAAAEVQTSAAASSTIFEIVAAGAVEPHGALLDASNAPPA